MKKYLFFLLAIGLIFGLSMSSAFAEEFFAGSADGIDTSAGKLAMYDASEGFFILPISFHGDLPNTEAVDHPKIAISDTIILRDDSASLVGLVIYRASDEMLFLNGVVGAGNESAQSASYFGEGDFVMIKTAHPDQCALLNLSQCRASGYVKSESSLFIQPEFSSDLSPLSTDVALQNVNEPASLLDGLKDFLGL